jgi:tetraprenyl-beta-curcumene synthase
MGALGDRRLMARAGVALLLANVRYWTSVAPVVRRELRHWEQRAGAIEDPELRALALEKLRGESLHAEAAAILATRAPRAHRRDAARAIVALELLFDYLDGLTERPSADPLREGERLFEAYVDALAGGCARNGAGPTDRYLRSLSETVSEALARLPAAGAIADVATASARRGVQAQVRMHAAPQLGTEQIERWARSETDGTGLAWRELLVGSASSVLTMHALIAAAAQPKTTPAHAAQIDGAYLSTGVLLTLLDGLIDHEHDHAEQAGDAKTNGAGPRESLASLGYLGFYHDRDELTETLTDAAQRAAAQAGALPGGAHHVMTLVGVVAYYTSAPGARGELAAPIVERLQEELTPLIFPALQIMRLWRLAKRVRSRRPPVTGSTTIISRETTQTGRVR